MLTLDQKHANEIKYMELLSKLDIDLTAISKFLDKIDFFNKPASTQYNKSYSGGLCEHALIVAHELGVLCNAYFPGKYTEADVIKVALFKDIYKATMYESYNKNIKNEITGQWESVVAYRTKEGSARDVYGDIGLSSYMQIRELLSLSTEQVEAIINAKATDNIPDIHDILRSYPLVTLTRMAEMAALYFN